MVVLNYELNESLKRYIRSTILKKYKTFDKAHNLQHVEKVIQNSLRYIDIVDDFINPAMVFTIAAYHDVGLSNGRDNHEKTSALFLRNDKKLRHWFSLGEIAVMAEAVEDHRASAKGNPRSIYGKIISDADRDIDYQTVLTRAIYFGLTNYPEYTWYQHWQRTYNHLHEKYGVSGYMTLWIDCDYNKDKLNELHRKLNAKSSLYLDFSRVLSDERSHQKELKNQKLLNEPVLRKFYYSILNSFHFV